MVNVTVTYTNGEVEVFMSIDDDTIKVENDILSFSGFYLDSYAVNMNHVRSYKVSI